MPARLDLRVDPGRLSYRLTDESARLNLNRATRDVLDRLLQEVGVEKTDRDVIIDSIQDWRDPNEEHRLNGAESDYYLALPVPYRSKNADFDSVDELLQVRGVTRDLLYGRGGTPGLIEYLTVFGTGAVNVNTVSPTVLRALGYAEAEIDLLMRATAFRRSGGDPAGPCGARTCARAARSSASRPGVAARLRAVESSRRSFSARARRPRSRRCRSRGAGRTRRDPPRRPRRALSVRGPGEGRDREPATTARRWPFR